MRTTALQEFISHAREKGMDHSTIRMLLKSAGWKEKDIAEALGASSLDFPIPLPPDAGGARDAFLHLLSFTTLYTFTISLGTLFFTYINRLLPDAALEGTMHYTPESDLSGIRWSMAAIIIAVPLFFRVMFMLSRDMRLSPEKAAEGVRRWLTYFTLLVTAGVLIGDGITLVYYFLEGELTARFLLKVMVILLLAGSVFCYYTRSMRLLPGDAALPRHNRNFIILTSVTILVGLVWGAVIIGSPATERFRKFDQRRVEDLRQITRTIFEHSFEGRIPEPWIESAPAKPLPQLITEVPRLATFNRPTITDPESKELYEYTVLSTNEFSVCTSFATEDDDDSDVLWNHPSGHHCYHINLQKREGIY